MNAVGVPDSTGQPCWVVLRAGTERFAGGAGHFTGVYPGGQATRQMDIRHEIAKQVEALPCGNAGASAPVRGFFGWFGAERRARRCAAPFRILSRRRFGPADDPSD